MTSKVITKNTDFDSQPFKNCCLCNEKQSDVKPFVKMDECLCVSKNAIHAHCMLLWQNMSMEYLNYTTIKTRCRTCSAHKSNELTLNDTIYNIKLTQTTPHYNSNNNFCIYSRKNSDTLTTIEKYKITTRNNYSANSNYSTNTVVILYDHGQVSDYSKTVTHHNFKYEGRRYRNVTSYEKTRIEVVRENTNSINCIEMYKDGKKNGETILFNPNHKNLISAILQFEDDKMEGKQKIYEISYTNELYLYEEYNCVNSIIVGPFKRYNHAGKIIIDANYDETGKLLFPYKQYHNTDKNNIMVLINDIPEEPTKMRVEEYHENERVKANYIRMKPSKMVNIKWYDIEREEVTSRICPPYIEYSSKGNIVQKRELDAETGFIKIETYHANKRLKYEKYVTNDKHENNRHTYKYYFDSGQLNLSYTYNDSGKLNGWYHEYFKNGQMKSSIFYNNGEFDGEYKKWNANGDILKDHRYVNGNFVPIATA